MTRKISTIERWLGTGIFLLLGGLLMLFFFAWDLCTRPTVRCASPIVEYDVEPIALAVLLLFVFFGVACCFGWGGETIPN